MNKRRVKEYELECKREGKEPKCIEIENSKEVDSIEVGYIPVDPPNYEHCSDGSMVLAPPPC